MSDGDDEEAVAGVGETGQRVVPGQEGGEQRKESTGLHDASGGGTGGVPDQVGDTQQQEGEVQREEQGEEGDGRLERAEQQQEGEDEPAL